MVTADEVARISIFADLGLEERERIARAAADISLSKGEYAAEPKAERALFGLLDGSIEAVRVDDGIPTVVGHRVPGDVFGEVPITLGTVFPVGFRAAEPSRVLRLDAHGYHTVAAFAPELVEKVGALARNRMEGARGLQGLASAPSPRRAIVVGHRWDGSCAAVRRFLDRNNVTYDWVPSDDPDALDKWGEALPSDEELPSIRVLESDTVVRPHLRQVSDFLSLEPETVLRPQLRRAAELLGLGTEPRADEYDVVVVGGGPGGLAAAVYGASEGLSVLVIEREAPGGQAGTSSRIENYLGFPNGVSGDELATRALEQAKRLGAEILVTQAIDEIDTSSRSVHLEVGDVLSARTIILACGVDWRRLPIEGLDQLVGKGVFYGAAKSDAAGMHGLDVHIIGAGNSAGQAALEFSKFAHRVSIVVRGETLEKSMSKYLIDQLVTRSNIEVVCGAEVVAAYGDPSLEEVEIHRARDGTTMRVASGGVYIFIGADAETGWLPPEIALDPKGYILTGSDVTAAGRWGLERDPYLLETSVPGIFACGDVRYSPVKRVAAAVGEGSMAIAFVHQYLRALGTPVGS
jgi:thioredoxin reductase (NADPH)